jgi:hypothetical protein
MAVLVTLEVLGGTTETYERTNEILGVRGEEDAPHGLVSHVCGVTGDGIVIVEVWDSPDSYDRFVHDRLSGALMEAGMPPAVPRLRRVHHLRHGSGTAASVLVMVEPPGLDAEAYDALVAELPAQDARALHVGAVKDDGTILIVDLWDSQESFAEFARTQVAEAAEDMGQVQPRVIPLYNHLRGPASAPA